MGLMTHMNDSKI